MPSLQTLSPLRAIRDLRVFLSARQPYELIFLALSLMVTTALIAGFVHDSYEERPYKRNIQYFESWPLTRSAQLWEERYASSDCGDPEGLAYKIEVFEAVDRRYGFEVHTPRIPGLAYRDYDDID